MNDFIILMLCMFSGFSTMLGLVFIYMPRLKEKYVLSFGFSLSFIVMFLISITELIPVGLSLVRSSYTNVGLIMYLFLFLVLGAFIIVKINDNLAMNNRLFKLGVLSTITILIHNIPEGIICAISGINDVKLGLKMILLIMLHNITEGISICIPIYYATGNRVKAFYYTFISGAGEVIGALLSILFLKYFITDVVLSMIYIMTAGIMIYLSVNKLLRESLNNKCYIATLLGIVAGGVILLLTL